jgi:arylsulfatase A-like enzyme
MLFARARRRRRCASLLLPSFAVSLALLCAACRQDPGPRRQAVFILLDAARADRFSAYGYGRETTPRIDRLARGGALFLSHYAQATATRGSLPKLLYSRYFAPGIMPNSPHVPLRQPADLFAHDPTMLSLPRALSAAGLATAAISAHTWTRPKTPFAAQFDELRDLSGEGGARPHASARQMVDGALAWLADHLDDEYFLYLHLMDTHLPHYLDEDARRFWGDGRRPARISESGWVKNPGRPLDGEARRYLDAVYDGDLRFADRELGRLFDFLERRGLLSRTLILITADHGEHLFERPGRETHGGPWLEAVARVPLIVHYPPRVAPRRIAALTEGIDLYPTISKLLGIPPPEGTHLDGHDLFDPESRDFAVGWRGIRDRRFTLLFETANEALLAEQEPALAALSGWLYDRRTDPAETRDLWAQRPDLVRRLLGAYRERLRRPFLRYRSARANIQPSEAFAVAAPRFRTAELPAAARVKTCGDLGSEPGWFRQVGAGQGFLAATPGAGPLELTIPMPDGRYRVTAAAMGSAEVRLDGAAEAVRIAGGPFDPGAYQQAPQLDLIEVEVTGERFGGVIEPGDEGCFLIWLFGFEPRTGEDGPVVEPQDVERLRALGYVG